MKPQSTFHWITILFIFIGLNLSAQETAFIVPEPSPLFTNPTLIILLVTTLVLMAVILSLVNALRNLSDAGKKKSPEKSTSATNLVLFLLAAGTGNTFAQGPQTDVFITDKLMPPAEIAGLDSVVFLIFTLVIAIEFIVILGLIKSIQNVLVGLGYQPEPEADKPLINWKWLDRKLTNAVPLEREAEVLTSHEYDGIKELDNKLPPWWVYGFYFTIIFSIVYLFDYHVLRTSPLSHGEYMQQMAEGEAQKKERLKKAGANVDENSVILLSDAGAVAAGKGIYDGNCASCHGIAGEGLVGPNLTDMYWLHGGGINNIFKTVKYGVPSKGMIAWQNQLSPEAIQKVSSYVVSLQGTKPANAKAPQGEIWNETSAPIPADSSNVDSLKTSSIASNQ
jgi:cytochrome c oxidase cbb3-type subunit 3